MKDEEDDHYFVVNGKRWRRTDPSIPEERRQQLVNELMKARRDVKTAKASDDDKLMNDARRRVHETKVALGERGKPWWEKHSEKDSE